MADGRTYQIDRETIMEQRMRFCVVNRRPKYGEKEKETVKAELREQLFTVFSKYTP